MNIRKIVETCIYSQDLSVMKKFYIELIGLTQVSEEKDKFLFLKAGSSMLLIFNPDKTMRRNEALPAHGVPSTPPSSIHFAMEISREDFDRWKKLITESNIEIESEVTWKAGGKSIYFRDPVGNLVELITPGEWPVSS